MRKILITIMMMTLTACGSGSGGGNDGGSGNTSPIGSASLNGLTYGYANNVCFSTSTIGTSASCSVSGTSSNQTSSATCSAGTAKVVCNVSGINYALATGGSSSADQACVTAGGSVQVSCPINTNGACSAASGVWTPANNPNVSTPTNCANAGGIFYSTLQHLTGSMPSANLSTGNNIISADPYEVATALGLFNGVSDLDNTNLSLVSMSATAAIGSYWEHSFNISSPSIYNFRSTAIEFSAGSPISTTGPITIKANTVTVYFQ